MYVNNINIDVNNINNDLNVIDVNIIDTDNSVIKAIDFIHFLFKENERSSSSRKSNL